MTETEQVMRHREAWLAQHPEEMEGLVAVGAPYYWTTTEKTLEWQMFVLSQAINDLSRVMTDDPFTKIMDKLNARA